MKDPIERADAIDAICKVCSMEEDYHKCDGYPETSTWCDELVALRALPSAQPKTEERTAESEQNVPKDDLISRKAAIDAIQQHRESVLGGYEYDEGVAFVYAAAHNHIIDVIKRLPSAQPELARNLHNACADLIRRQDAIGAILSVVHIAELSDGDAVIRVSAVNYVLGNLPTAQPEPCEDKKELKVWFLRMASYVDSLLECSDEQKETLVNLISKVADYMPWAPDDPDVPEPCEDAVSRRRLLSDLKKLIVAWEKYPVMAEQLKGVETAIGYVEAIPSVTPKRKTGKWISLDDSRGKYNDYGFKCSECGEHSDYEENFCPNCGADMRGEQDERSNQQTGSD